MKGRKKVRKNRSSFWSNGNAHRSLVFEVMVHKFIQNINNTIFKQNVFYFVKKLFCLRFFEHIQTHIPLSYSPIKRW